MNETITLVVAVATTKTKALLSAGGAGTPITCNTCLSKGLVMPTVCHIRASMKFDIDKLYDSGRKDPRELIVTPDDCARLLSIVTPSEFSCQPPYIMFIVPAWIHAMCMIPRGFCCSSKRAVAYNISETMVAAYTGSDIRQTWRSSRAS